MVKVLDAAHHRAKCSNIFQQQGKTKLCAHQEGGSSLSILTATVFLRAIGAGGIDRLDLQA
eukprot:6484419-Amphidinium_carterae.2